MTLANLDLELIRERVISAYDADSQLFEKFREYAKLIKREVRPLRRYSVDTAISFIAADGGSNKILFNPSTIELVHVVDSRGNQYLLDTLSGGSHVQEIERQIASDSKHPLRNMCRDFGMTLGDMSDLMKRMGEEGTKTAVHCYREIIEWAVLYDMVTSKESNWPCNTIIVRDGLLRSLYFKRNVFPLLDKKLQAGVQVQREKNVELSIVGLAKQSAVLSRLSVALELEGAFNKAFPCYVQIPKEIEDECYKNNRAWFDSSDAAGLGVANYNSMGVMHLVKFGNRTMDPVWPVDVPSWQIDNAEKILGQLMVDAQQGFPIPDYPMCVQRAHDFAKVSKLQVEILQDIILEGLTERLTTQEFERLLRMKYLGQNLAALRYKEV